MVRSRGQDVPGDKRTYKKRIAQRAALVAIVAGAVSPAFAQNPQQLVQQICIACHNEHLQQAGLNLRGFDAEHPELSPVIAEKMIRKLRAGQMPPREMPRDEVAIMNLVTTLESGLDRHARSEKRAGTRPFQRVNRAEYARLIYDLLGLTIDPAEWPPAVKFLVEDCGIDVNARDANGYTPLHHAAARGDNTLIAYLIEKGADLTVVSRKGQITADMANGPTQRVSPFPDTIALLVSLGAINNNCVSC